MAILPNTGDGMTIQCDKCGHHERSTSAEQSRLAPHESGTVVFLRRGWNLGLYVDTCPSCRENIPAQDGGLGQTEKLAQYLLREWGDHPAWVIDEACLDGKSAVDLAIAILTQCKVDMTGADHDKPASLGTVINDPNGGRR